METISGVRIDLPISAIISYCKVNRFLISYLLIFIRSFLFLILNLLNLEFQSPPDPIIDFIFKGNSVSNLSGL